MSLPENDYTIVLVPEGNGRIKRIRVTQQQLKKLFVAVACVLGFGFLATGYSLYNLATLPERWQLEEEMLAQQMHLAEIAQKLDTAEATITRIGRLDQKLRVVLGKGTEGEDGLTGIGGPSNESINRFDSLPREESRLVFARLDSRVDRVRHDADSQEMNLHDLDALMTDQASRLSGTPSLWPTRGWVTSHFGPRTDPFTGRKKVHEGIDIATRQGNPVVATADGIVVFAGVKPGYGKIVIVDHGYEVGSRYAHLSRIDVKAGQLVQRGELVGRVGSTGNSTGPHVHYEVHVAGVPVNPYRYILIEDSPLP